MTCKNSITDEANSRQRPPNSLPSSDRGTPTSLLHSRPMKLRLRSVAALVCTVLLLTTPVASLDYDCQNCAYGDCSRALNGGYGQYCGYYSGASGFEWCCCASDTTCGYSNSEYSCIPRKRHHHHPPQPSRRGRLSPVHRPGRLSPIHCRGSMLALVSALLSAWRSPCTGATLSASLRTRRPQLQHWEQEG